MSGTVNSVESSYYTCPQCNNLIKAHTGYVVWCENCDWNLNPAEAAEYKNIFESIYASFGKKLNESMLDRLVDQRSLKSTFNLSKVIAYILAFFIHSFTLIFTVSGVVFLIKLHFSFISILFAILCMGFAFLVFPRFPKDPGTQLRRQEHPALYKIIDEIVKTLNARKVDGIVIDGKYNASYGIYGYKRRKILHIGLPLFLSLENDEKVALISHEIAHGINGDCTRGFFVGSAIHTLVQWHDIIVPEQIIATKTDDAILVIAMIPVNLFLLGISKILLLFIRVYSHILWHDSQRAEYLADYLGACISGKDAMISMLRKLYFDKTFALVAQRAVHNKDIVNIFSELSKEMNSVPESELKRINRISLSEISKLDATHPPTGYRIRFLQSKENMFPSHYIQQNEFDTLNEELRKLEGKTHENILAEFRGRLYR